MGTGRHQASELHPDIFVRCVLGLGALAVIELGGIVVLLWRML